MQPKYRFQYLDEFPRPFRPVALAFGSSIHAALAWLHEQMQKGKDVSADKARRIFDADWYAQRLDTKILYDSRETEASLHALAKELMQALPCPPGKPGPRTPKSISLYPWPIPPTANNWK